MTTEHRPAKKRSKNWSAVGIVAMFVLIVAGVVSCEVSIWRECRTDHSWLYCMKVLGSK